MQRKTFSFNSIQNDALLLKLCTSFNLESRKRVKGKTGGVLFWSFQCVKKKKVFFFYYHIVLSNIKSNEPKWNSSLCILQRKKFAENLWIAVSSLFKSYFLLWYSGCFCLHGKSIKDTNCLLFLPKARSLYAPSSCCPHLSSIQHLYHCPLWLSSPPPPLPLPAPHQSLFRGAISKSAFPPASVFTFTPACRRPLEEAT